MKFIIIPKELYDSVSEEKRRELGIDSPRASVDGSKVILHIEHYDHLFKSLDMQADDEPQSRIRYMTALLLSLNLFFHLKNGCPMLITNIFDLVMVGTIAIFVKS